MTNQQRIECVFVSSMAAVPAYLDSDRALRAGSVYFELAGSSTLAALFAASPDTSVRRAGITALMAPAAAQRDAAFWHHSDIPIVLAPEPAVSDSAVEAAVAMLSTTTMPFERAVLVAAAGDAERFTGAYEYVDRFSVWWDVADLPGPALARLADVLAGVTGIGRSRWGGFHVGASPARPIADAPARRGAMQAVIDAYPRLAA